MIASTAVARWTWGREADSDDWTEEAVRTALGTYGVLTRHRLALPDSASTVRISEYGRSRNLLLVQDFQPSSLTTDASVHPFLRALENNASPGRISSIDVSTHCPGIWYDGRSEHREEKLFSFTTSVTLGFLTLEMRTFSDAWMPFDLRGREQSAVHTENQPRLATALGEISALIGDEVDPDDSTQYGIPTATGVENHTEDDGTASDVWQAFEVPYRNQVFRFTAETRTTDYARSASGPITYLQVASAHKVLGYVWASDKEEAASFEPAESAGEEGYRAGLVWLGRLRAAKERGLRPLQALTRLRDEPMSRTAGHIVPDFTGAQKSLTDLFGLARNT
ncbi:hypothetical protein MTQ13_24295 [Streptomyces sp. XM4011]|uniref:hypothetical protein n=1 Tax=Streptomyces TaxID=1883 RepID=UPI001FF70CAE|nr:hypothetical protein [Streptomyces sp. XM4011]MCK1817364.1 hypothetical protein [Streptomyces sp. XM4011]